MLNERIQIFQTSQYLQNSYEDMKLPLQKSSSSGFEQDISLNKNISSEIQIIRRIGNYNLAWPIIITVSYEDDLVFIKEETLNIWGEGNTFEEALKSFEDFFIYDFESYKNTPPEKMDFFARQELKLYKALLNISK